MTLKATEEALKIEGVLDAISDFGIKLKNQRRLIDGTFEFDVENMIEEGTLDLYFSEKDGKIRVADYDIKNT